MHLPQSGWPAQQLGPSTCYFQYEDDNRSQQALAKEFRLALARVHVAELKRTKANTQLCSATSVPRKRSVRKSSTLLEERQLACAPVTLSKKFTVTSAIRQRLYHAQRQCGQFERAHAQNCSHSCALATQQPQREFLRAFHSRAHHGHIIATPVTILPLSHVHVVALASAPGYCDDSSHTLIRAG